MASVLASQLAQLAGKGPQEKWVRGKASLLAPAAHHLAALRARTFCSTHLSV